MCTINDCSGVFAFKQSDVTFDPLFAGVTEQCMMLHPVFSWLN